MFESKSSGSEELLPPLKLPLLYFAFAALCFAAAMAGAACYAQDFTDFYYHPRVLALTHLVTLGWITGNILGSLYIVAPMSLRMWLRAGVLDYAIFFLFAAGVCGMAAHFWIGHDPGMAWSAGCVYFSLLVFGTRLFRALSAARAPGFVRLHIGLAFTNLFVAGGWGVLVAVNKVHGFLPTSSGPNVIAHVHMAAAGWATLLVFGIAYRLLPMFLPGSPEQGKWPWVSAFLFETGVIGLFLCSLMQSSLVTVFGGLIGAGIFLFLFSAARTAMKRKPVPPPLPPVPDFSILHAAVAFFWLVGSLILGLVLTRMEANEESLQIALAYGILGLVGFLAQIVVGMKPKILSVFTWYYAFTRTGSIEGIPRPVDMPNRTFQMVTFPLWVLGVPLLAFGAWQRSRMPVAAGAIFLLAALTLSTIHEISILRRIPRKTV